MDYYKKGQGKDVFYISDVVVYRLVSASTKCAAFDEVVAFIVCGFCPIYLCDYF